jgi:hypothetical protein
LLSSVAIAMLACGLTGGSPIAATSSSPPPVASLSPSASSSPSSSPSPASASPVEVLSVVYLNGNITIHLLTVSQGTARDRPLLANQPVSVLDANQRDALITTTNSTRLATLDFGTGALRTLPMRSAGEIEWGALSPDGKQAALSVRHADLVSYEILIVDLASSTVHSLLQVPASAYNRAGLYIWRWTSSGILVSPAVWDGPRFGLSILNPQSGKLTPLAKGQVDALSPDSSMLAASGHANLGDRQFAGQGIWPNQLKAGPVKGPALVIAEHKNRAFYALDVGDDGSVMYMADDAPFNANGSWPNEARPAPDMGIYVESGGASVQQLGETRVGQWAAGRFVGAGLALVARIVKQGPAGTAEVDLVSLCSGSGCPATTQPVETVSGKYPQPSLTLLRQVAAA